MAKAVAYQAVLHGHKVQYLETDDFFNRYALSAQEQRQARLRAILDCDLRARRPVPLTYDPRRRRRTFADPDPSALQVASKRGGHLQSCRTGLGRLSWRQHDEHHDP
ncbi:protein of unknown function [Caballeronia sp. S22]